MKHKLSYNEHNIVLLLATTLSNGLGHNTLETPVPVRSLNTKLIGLKVQKASEKALALLKGNLELPLRPIQATQMTTGPFWTRQKRLEAFWTSNRNLVT